MSDTPSSPAPVILRRVVREVMQRAPQRPWTVRAMRDLLRGTDYPDVTEEQTKEVIHFNQRKGFMDFSVDNETEVETWLLTERGLTA